MRYVLMAFAMVFSLSTSVYASQPAGLSAEDIKAVQQSVIKERVPQQFSRDVAKTVVMTEGFIDPAKFDNPEYADFHVAAHLWLSGIVQNEGVDGLTALANQFHAQTGQGKKIDGFKQLEATLGWPAALANYKEKIDGCLKGQGGVCNVSGFALKGSIKKFNVHVVNLSAAYINAIKPFVDQEVKTLTQ